MTLAEVLALAGYLLRHSREELEIGLVRARGCLLPADTDEVADVHRAGLAEAVDAADALLEPVRIERNVVVQDAAAVGLQVDALAGGVGGEQDADRVARRWRLEGGLEVFAGGGVHPAVQQAKSVAAEASRIEQTR